ncbi:class I SAM-dependent methyltransferase [Pseudogemmobacter sp. W21_MBD1_M6]|uniref:class I SAM-dependent methyltransferase n=1 Tax=Pseudogemmobacter sp. W21_MBD1_M6 TaxID=3240271 RepID=UPI003F9A2446
MWTTALDHMLGALLRQGSVTLHLPDGSQRRYGDGTGDPVTVRLHDRATVAHLARNPELAFGESYMNGTLTIDGDDLQGLMAIIVTNYNTHRPVWWMRWLGRTRTTLRRLRQNNIAPSSRRNVAHHYDLSSALFDLFLDHDRQYSCGYFHTPDDTLERAQSRKKAHIAGKLLIEPGMRVLDIGCGWGGLALTLARDHGAQVVGVTLSQEQHKIATQRALREGLSDRVDFRLTDYRDVTETFDRIVSVGMFEHVGLPHFQPYFATIRDRLTPDGVALIHTIGRSAPPEATNPWMAKYIFPGGYIPSMSEVTAAIEAEGLWLDDIECLRLHYAYTLRHWYDRFNANADKVRQIYDDRFIRMWRFYIAACEQTFRHGRQAVFQFQISRRIDAVPLTRDYLYQPDIGAAHRNAAE